MRLTVRRRAFVLAAALLTAACTPHSNWAPGLRPVRPASGALHLTDVHASF